MQSWESGKRSTVRRGFCNGHNRRQQAGCTHAPVKDEHQREHGMHHRGTARDIRQVVGQQRLRIGGRAVETVAFRRACQVFSGLQLMSRSTVTS